MKKLKAFILLGLLFPFGILWGNNLKESVAIIRHDDSSKDSLFTQLSLTLQQNGFISAAKTLRSYPNSFGSGFVYKAKSGNVYVVTNHHVIVNNTSASLQLYVQGKDMVFKDCSVLYSHPQIDIALIQAPSIITDKAIQAYSADIKDGQEVFSAGYPGLGVSPLWQFGKGVISNKEVNSGHFGNKDSLLIIQHTAPVDAGNSGGPLLVKGNDSIYSVVGVNTWKGRFRENTNFSIRLSDLDKVIDMYESNQEVDTISFETIKNEFLVAINGGYSQVADYISVDYILSLDNEELSYMLKNSDHVVFDAIRKNPITGLKLMVANDMFNKIGKVKELSLVEVKRESETFYKTIFVDKKKIFEFKWQKTSLGWKIVDIKYENVKSIKKGSVSNSQQDFGIRTSLFNQNVEVGVSFPIHEKQNYGFNFAYNGSFQTYGLFSVNLDVNGYVVPDEYESWHPYYEGEKNKFGACVNFGVGAQVPIALKRFMITPYTVGIFGIGGYPDRHSSIVQLCVGARAGSRFGYMVSNDVQLYLALEYNYRYSLFSIDNANVGDNFPNHLLLKLGVEW